METCHVKIVYTNQVQCSVIYDIFEPPFNRVIFFQNTH